MNATLDQSRRGTGRWARTWRRTKSQRRRTWAAQPGELGGYSPPPPPFLPNFCKIFLFGLKFWHFYANSPFTFQLAPALSNSLRRLWRREEEVSVPSSSPTRGPPPEFPQRLWCRVMNCSKKGPRGKDPKFTKIYRSFVILGWNFKYFFSSLHFSSNVNPIISHYSKIRKAFFCFPLIQKYRSDPSYIFNRCECPHWDVWTIKAKPTKCSHQKVQKAHWILQYTR